MLMSGEETGLTAESTARVPSLLLGDKEKNNMYVHIYILYSIIV